MAMHSRLQCRRSLAPPRSHPQTQLPKCVHPVVAPARTAGPRPPPVASLPLPADPWRAAARAPCASCTAHPSGCRAGGKQWRSRCVKGECGGRGHGGLQAGGGEHASMRAHSCQPPAPNHPLPAAPLPAKTGSGPHPGRAAAAPPKTEPTNAPADNGLLVRALQSRLHVNILLLLAGGLGLADAVKEDLLHVAHRHRVITALLGRFTKALPLPPLRRDLHSQAQGARVSGPLCRAEQPSQGACALNSFGCRCDHPGPHREAGRQGAGLRAQHAAPCTLAAACTERASGSGCSCHSQFPQACTELMIQHSDWQACWSACNAVCRLEGWAASAPLTPSRPQCSPCRSSSPRSPP